MFSNEFNTNLLNTSSLDISFIDEESIQFYVDSSLMKKLKESWMIVVVACAMTIYQDKIFLASTLL
jgi:hypothetical protein